MMNSINITTVLCVVIIIGFFIYSYLKYLNKKSLSSFRQNTGQSKNNIDFPECPDFFEVIDNNGKKVCKNTYKLGKCRIDNDHNTVSFDDELFNNIKNGNYYKCRWSKECDTPWQNIERLC
jgi:hypothetical protein